MPRATIKAPEAPKAPEAAVVKCPDANNEHCNGNDENCLV
jgi:hypothetical protein